MMMAMSSPLSVNVAIVSVLMPWGIEHRRDLPWRQTRDPWAIVVSETMLQQTQVDRVIPKYQTFLDRFPTVESCAAGDQAEVVRLWAGLGYNRRAVNLHRLAQQVVAKFGSVIPLGLEDLLTLPGVGPYTARAVQVFADEQDVGVVDTNVGRVLARWSGRSLGSSEAQQLADAWVPRGQAWAWTQALFDFGSAVCSKRNPACADCPVASECKWQGRGEDPAQGSAATTSGQSRFEGSFRQGRGRVISALRDEEFSAANLSQVTGWDSAKRIDDCMRSLEKDEIIEQVNGRWRLR